MDSIQLATHRACSRSRTRRRLLLLLLRPETEVLASSATCGAMQASVRYAASARCWAWIMLARRPETQAEVPDLGGMREGAGSESADHGWPIRELSSSGDLVKDIRGNIAGWRDRTAGYF